MADYKVVDAEKLNADLSGVANAIRAKAETSGGLVFPEGFISAVNGIKKGIIPTEIIDITSNNISNQDITYGKTLNVNVPVTHFASGTVSNVTAGQQLTVTGIKDILTGEAFTPQGVFGFVEVTSNTTLYPANHKNNIPAVFCFVRDNRTKFGIAMACFSTEDKVANLREVRFNADIGGVSGKENTYITFSGNSFTYVGVTSMYGLLGASKWRWAAWG